MQLIKTKYLYLLFILINTNFTAQLIDDFSDGDFTTNPTWLGHTAKFQVNNGMLQSNGSSSSADTLVLATPSSLIDSVEWRFFMRLDFNPTSSNYVKIYLVSDSSNLQGSLNGYFLKIGETGNSDTLELYRQTGNTETKILTGISAFGSTTQAGIKVTRDSSGNWKLYVDANGGVNYNYEGGVMDNVHDSSSYFGVYCKYSTASRFDKYFFDDFNVAFIEKDTTPPAILSSNIKCSNSLELTFSESLTLSAENITNYELLNGNIAPLSVINNNDIYELSFSNSFNGGDTLALEVSNIEDLSGNFLNDTIYIIISDTTGNIVLSDNFCDGDLSSNPTWYGQDTLFNVNLSGELQLNDTADLFNEAYLSASTGILDFSNTIVWNFRINLLFEPSSSNQGRFYLVSDNVDLSSPLNGYYLQIGEGGSADKLKLYRQDGVSSSSDPLICTGMYGAYGLSPNARVRVTRDIAGNWLIEADSLGGSNFIFEAGGTDSVHTFSMFSGIYTRYTNLNSENIIFDDIYISAQVLIDTNSPVVLSAKVTGTNLLDITYYEPFGLTTSAEDIMNYYLADGNGNPLLATNNGTYYQLLFNSNFIAGDTLALQLSNIEDLSANILNDTIYIIVPDTAFSGEIIINEILFNPFTGGSDYIELYNNSNKTIDLYNYFIADYDVGIDNHKTIPRHYLLAPNEFVLLTEDSASTMADYPSNDVSVFIEMDLPSFIDDSATAYVLNPDSIILDKFSYDDNMHFELINDVEGVSLERINYDISSDDLSNWHSAAESVFWGTPGIKNSNYYGDISFLEFFNVETEVFSPNNDGFEDIGVFSYQMQSAGWIGNITIFDASGRTVKRLIENELLASEGVISWDGIINNNQKARSGIYIVYFEAFNLNGNIISDKKTITVAMNL